VTPRFAYAYLLPALALVPLPSLHVSGGAWFEAWRRLKAHRAKRALLLVFLMAGMTARRLASPACGRHLKRNVFGGFDTFAISCAVAGGMGDLLPLPSLSLRGLVALGGSCAAVFARHLSIFPCVFVLLGDKLLKARNGALASFALSTSGVAATHVAAHVREGSVLSLAPA